MGRYSLNLRPIYGPNEPTGGELISRGIGGALEDYMNVQNARRTERNQVGAAGGTILPDDPENSIGGRFRKIKRGIGALLGRNGGAPGQAPPPNQGTDIGASQGGYTDYGGFTHQIPRMPNSASDPTYGGPMTGQSPYGDREAMDENPNMMNRPSAGWDERIPANVTGNPMARGPSSMPPVNGTQGGQQRYVNEADQLYPKQGPPSGAPAANQYGGAGGGGGGNSRIGQAIGGSLGDNETYTYEGSGGMRARMPNVIGQAHMQADAKSMLSDIEDEKKIKALVDAGMDPREARARVLNNVVRYDETFGQQRGGANGRGGMTQSERLEIQDRMDRRAAASASLQRQLAGIRSGDSRSRMTLTQQIAEMRQQQQADLALLRSDQQEATSADAAANKLQTDPIAGNTPEGQAAAAAARQRAEAARGRTATDRTRAALPPLSAAQKTRASTDARYKAFLQSQGYRLP